MQTKNNKWKNNEKRNHFAIFWEEEKQREMHKSFLVNDFNSVLWYCVCYIHINFVTEMQSNGDNNNNNSVGMRGDAQQGAGDKSW